MKYILVVIGLFVFNLSWQAQKPGTVWPQGEAGKDYNVKDTKGKKQGPWIRIHQGTKNLYYRGQFKDNVPTGVFEFYYETGELYSKVDHVQDTTINDVILYHPDGTTMMSQGRYLGLKVDGLWKRRKQGLWKFYDEQGTLRTEENYHHDVLMGQSKHFHPDGAPLSDHLYVDGKKQGPFTEWFDNGKIKATGSYVNDQLDGSFVLYRATGKKEAEGKYANGLKTGRWISYTSNGSIEMQVLYEEGKEVNRRYENGEFTEYYPSGIPKSRYTYSGGQKDGPFIEWYDIGTYEMVPAEPGDAEMGIAQRQKLTGTKIKCEGDYLNDVQEGEIKYYDERGLLTKTEVWQDGKLLSTK